MGMRHAMAEQPWEPETPDEDLSQDPGIRGGPRADEPEDEGGMEEPESPADPHGIDAPGSPTEPPPVD
jgi:hypothetical protein